jgi:thiaminase/transcriptional activator TenA
MTQGEAPDFEFGLFGRLRRDARDAWEAYASHPFLAALAAGRLPRAGFQTYLIQDYLFLIDYARAYALAAHKSDSLEEMTAASQTMAALLAVEMPLHIAYCGEWGISEAELQAARPDLRMTAYTSFVLARGSSGDRLDLDVALAPCLAGYAAIAERLLAAPETVLEGNPYAPWIRLYAGPAYRAVAAAAIRALDQSGARRGAETRYPALLATFRTACLLEAQFWDIGWHDQAAERP